MSTNDSEGRMLRKLTRRQFLKAGAAAGFGGILAACGAGAGTGSAPAATSAPAAGGGAATAPAAGAATAAPAAGGAAMSMDQLAAAAKQEGMLTTIALPHDWLNYGEMLDSFKKKYGLQINELNPDGGSGDEIEAIKANKDNKGPQAPDVIDVGFSFGPSAKKDGLIQPYKVATWDTIANDLKDPEGYWYGDYYGVLSFEVNKDAVKNSPQDWADLLKPEYKGQVALAGDPKVSSQAINGVYAAALANGGSLDNAQPGLDFFAKLNQAGNFVPVKGLAGTLAQGATPIIIRWDYLALGDRDTLKGNPQVEVIIPKSGVFGGVYAQAISAYAPHPNAAKLWMEYLYSDEGQLIWLKGYGHPIRYNDLVKRNVIPADLATKLPPAELYAKAVFPKIEQQDAAKKLITEGWDKSVNVQVK
jgi:putative spermidine/putrescine transport system substrate-binding protein